VGFGVDVYEALDRLVKFRMEWASESDWVDTEVWHEEADKVMEELLIELGYEPVVTYIREHSRWYV
jgi:hypothetical protein